MYPDGRSILIADYHRRASFRAGLNLPPTPLAVGETPHTTSALMRSVVSSVPNSASRSRTTWSSCQSGSGPCGASSGRDSYSAGSWRVFQRYSKF